MKQITESAQRDMNQFRGAVLDSFSYLEKQYGFSRIVTQPDTHSMVIRYASDVLYVTLIYGPPAYEPEMVFGRRGVDDAPGAYSFEAGDLIQLHCCKDWKWKKDYPSHVVGLVSEFARLLLECGRQCLGYDTAIFNEMKTRRDRAIHDWKREEINKAIRGKLQNAWAEKDYEEAARLLSSIDGDLTDVERQKLAFAKKHS